jgi:hypothetical protein
LEHLEYFWWGLDRLVYVRINQAHIVIDLIGKSGKTKKTKPTRFRKNENQLFKN